MMKVATVPPLVVILSVLISKNIKLVSPIVFQNVCVINLPFLYIRQDNSTLLFRLFRLIW